MIKPRHNSSRAGFTLVELIVAIAILSIIVVAAAQILSTASTLTTSNNKHMDANDQARTVFDRLTNDFSRMVKRKDVDYLFWKATTSAPTPGNDTMYFFTEGASYFDTSTYTAPSGATNNSEKSSVSLVGYRINNLSTGSTYNQLERLGKALSWDGGAYNSSPPTGNSKQPNLAVFLTYPPAGYDVTSAAPYTDPIINTLGTKYSAAYFDSTIYGAYSNNSSGSPSAVGTLNGSFNDSTDTAYRVVGSQVFRFEYSFQLKDGTMSDKPMMVYTGSSSLPGTNGIPSSTITATAPPTHSADSSTKLNSVSVAVGSRWWDKKHQIGYICIDATPGYAIWHEIGIQDIAAITITIAVIDQQGLVYINSVSGDLSLIAAALPDYDPTVTTSTVTGNPAYLLDPTNTSGWAYALLPGQAISTTAVSSSGTTFMPQPMISQIRLYQRSFYLNNF